MDDVSESNTSETEHLLDQIGTGNRRALDDLLGQHRSYLRRVVERCLDWRLLARVDVSDVVQDTQMEVFRRLDDYLRRRPMPFRLWLWKTAYQRTLALRRQHLVAERRSTSREVPLPDRSSLLLARQALGASSASRQMARKETAERVRQALAKLPDADREILIMRAYDGLSNHEIAAIIDLDSGGVSKRYGRALVRLHRVLAAEGVVEANP